MTNGYWVGRVVLLDGVKHIYVEATRRVLRLTHEYAKSITAYIISEQKGDANMKCDCCKNTASYYAKSNGYLVFKCEDCLKDMSITNHDHLNWEYILKDFYGGKQK